MRNGRIIIFTRLWVDGMALFPFILLRRSSGANDKKLINHERIHLRQQLELLIIPFYLLYLFFYLFNLGRYLNHWQAYKNIPFEKEAYAHDGNPEYLAGRKNFAFLEYW